MRRSIVACAALLGLSFNAQAAPPSVAVDIAPLHSLVSQVMGDVAQPNLIIPAEASPHSYALRPSQAKALATADIVFWMGEGLTPWLEKSLENLAGSAQKIEALEIKNTTTYGFREGATFESHDHDHGHDEHEKEAHEDDHHDEHKHDKHHDDHKEEGHKEDKHGHEEHHDDDHKDEHKDEHHDEHHDEHEGSDPHAWLDPENAKVWVSHISEVLSKKDPENAATYSSNANATLASLDAMIAATRTQIEAAGQPKFIVFHDAYQYFEKRFGISAAGSISLGDAKDPSPARIKEIQETVKKLGVNCIFTEPQYDPGLVKNVFAGTSVTTIGVMDPLGASIPEGKGHYQALIEGMVKSVTECK